MKNKKIKTKRPLLKYSLKRLRAMIITLSLLIVIVFSLFKMLPENTYLDIDPSMSDEKIEVKREEQLTKMGLNGNFFEQLGRYFVRILPIPTETCVQYGEILVDKDNPFGESEWGCMKKETRIIDFGNPIQYSTNQTVIEMLQERVPISATIGIFTLLITYILGIPLGIMMAKHKNKLLDKLGNGWIVATIAIPGLVLYFIVYRVHLKNMDSMGMIIGIILGLVVGAITSGLITSKTSKLIKDKYTVQKILANVVGIVVLTIAIKIFIDFISIATSVFGINVLANISNNIKFIVSLVAASGLIYLNFTKSSRVVIKKQANAALAIIYIAIIATILGLIFNVTIGRVSPMFNDNTNLGSWLVPILTGSIIGMSGTAMWVRRYMIDEMSSDYVKFARSNGLSENKIMFTHVFRNAVVFLVRSFPTAFILTLAGSFFTEEIWGIPGTGRLMIESIQKYDFSLMIALVTIYSGLSMFSLLLGDILTVYVDPRISLTKNK